MQGEIPALVKSLSGLVVLASCVCMAVPSKKPARHNPPALEPAGPKPKKATGAKKQTAEAREFASLPPQLQRQVLDYARNWINANYER